MISFHHAELTPQSFNVERIVDLLGQQGFVILKADAVSVNYDGNDPVVSAQHRLKVIETLLGLKELDISFADKTHYSERLGALSGYNIIGKPDVEVKHDHPAFDSNEAQDFHIDGVFKPLGYVKTVVMTCARKALSGGESQLFNVVGAIEQLKASHPHWIEAFKDKRALRRRSTYSVKSGDYTDALLGTLEETGEPVVRMDFGDSSDVAASRETVPHFEEAFYGLKALSRGDSPYVLSFVLEAGQTLIIDNTQVAHGRAAFTDSADHRRKLVRAKYVDRIVLPEMKKRCG